MWRCSQKFAGTRQDGRQHDTSSGFRNGYIDISINLAGLNYEDYRGLRLFELSGKKYRDITTYVDERRLVISGRTTRLSSYVVMRPSAR